MGITQGTTFTVTNPGDYRFGRTYRITGFSADKGGLRYAICEWIEEQGFKSSPIFYVYDLIS